MVDRTSENACTTGRNSLGRKLCRLIFCEHGLAPDPGVRRVQNLINPLWRRIGGGCNVNRDIPDLLRESGFAIDSLDTMYLPGTPRFGGFNYWGTARVG